jgi:hypothetical protein
MKTNQEILDAFGKIIINDCFDPCLEQIDALRAKESVPKIFEDYSNSLKKLSHSDYAVLREYFGKSFGGILFGILRIFDEHREFKLTYEDNSQCVDLVKISESLKAEPVIENGWIERFSKEIKK